MQVRYPFLDKQLVQEFLLLAPALKASSYMAPFLAFLEAREFPLGPHARRQAASQAREEL